jgi:alpha-L-arabinofuranosidase
VQSETYPIKAEGLESDLARNADVPFVDVTATFDPQTKRGTVLMLNRDLQDERELALDWRDATPARVLVCETLAGTDLKAFNTFANPKTVVPRPLDAPKVGSTMTFKLPARSYTVAQLAL